MPRLILSTAEGDHAIDLRAVNSLGRHPSNSIQLLDKIVSKEHCIVEQRGERFLLRDLGSLNGTYINGERVAGERYLVHGDEISLGSTRARYDDGSGPLAPPGALSPGVVSTAVLAPPAQTTAPLHPAGAPSAAAAWQRPQHPASQPLPVVPQGYVPPTPPASAYRPQQHPASAPQFAAPAPSFDPQAQRPMPPSAPMPVTKPSPVHEPPRPQAMGPGFPMPAAPYAVGSGTQALPAMTVPLAPTSHRHGLNRTRVDMLDAGRQIGAQIAAQTVGFPPFDIVARDPQQLRVDYERLRQSWELTREIGTEHNLDKLLEKILLSLFKFVNADRGVILLRDDGGALQPRAARRRDGTDAPIQISTTILNHVMQERASVLTHDAALDFAAAKGKSMILNRISSAMVVPLIHDAKNGTVLGALWLDSESLAQFQPKDLEVVTAVVGQAAMFIENTLLQKKIEKEILMRERFARFVAPNVAEQLEKGTLEVRQGGELIADLTVFNSDIRGFTAMSEGTSAEELIDMLNDYFERMVDTVYQFEGTLDKFMGDGLMAFWGAPVAHPDDASRAVSCALEQMEVLGQFNRTRAANNKEPLAIGIGIHTGPVVAGGVGSSKTLSYTVIGDTANTSARLCGTALPGQIIVSERTLSKLGDKFEYEEVEAQSLKGKEKPLRRFNILRERR